ncbi:MAG TPA: nuclear transport factor 2 family protein [Sphingomicrobium sp.]
MGAKLIIICASCVILAGCMKQSTPKDDSANAQQQIEAALGKWQKAFEAKDVNGVMAMYAPDVTAYDIVPPLEYKGAGAYRKDYADFFGQFDGPLHIDMSNNHLEISGDLAVVYGLERISGKLKGGQPTGTWVRYTSVFKRTGNDWRDIHDHVSLPVDLNTGKAAMDLKPSA